MGVKYVNQVTKKDSAQAAGPCGGDVGGVDCLTGCGVGAAGHCPCGAGGRGEYVGMVRA